MKTIETAQRVKVAQAQIQSLKFTIKRSELAEQEISKLPDGTNTYQSVGRMYATGFGCGWVVTSPPLPLLSLGPQWLEQWVGTPKVVGSIPA